MKDEEPPRGLTANARADWNALGSGKGDTAEHDTDPAKDPNDRPDRAATLPDRLSATDRLPVTDRPPATARRWLTSAMPPGTP